MMTIGTWTFQATENGFKDISDEWDWAPFPNPTSNGGEPSFLLALGTTLSINGQSKSSDSAAKVIDFIFKKKALVLDMANDFIFGEFVIPLKYTSEDFGDNVNPKVRRYLIEFAEATGKGNYGYTTWTFWPSEPGVHIWKDMEVIWAGELNAQEYMEDHEKLWSKARRKNATLPVDKR
jgi:raffinose/stachyose/melibiose transport system substrate-binding protein